MSRSYERPQSLEALLEMLPQRSWTILAGGTDIYPAATHAQAWGHAAPDHVLDVTAIESLRRIEESADAYRIGCLVTWSQLIRSGLPDWWKCLRQAGCEVGARQVQNRATLVGNICNASPAADGVPALLVLDAEVELTGVSGTRTVPLSRFIIGNRKTQCRDDELVTGIIVPKRGPEARSIFLKLGARRYLVISIAMVAVLLEAGADGVIGQARVAVGACSEVAQRIVRLEERLLGLKLSDSLERAVEADMLDGLSPIDDVRSSAAYRRQSAAVLLRRSLAALRGSPEVSADG